MKGRMRRRALTPVLLLLFITGCAIGPVPRPVSRQPGIPQIRIAIIADPHIFDTATSSPGPSYERGLRSGIKLLAESRAILEAALRAIASEKPDIVLVCGDLTRDGEQSAHELAALELGALERGLPGQPGPRVYVVPGNHDILNPHAARFEGETSMRVPSIAPEEFAALYAALGFDEAIRRDPASLSYLVQPAPGLWVLAIDSCRYRENGNHPVPGGRMDPATLAWVKRILEDARSRNTAVIAFMHHGAVEHFQGQTMFEPGRIVEGAGRFARLLMDGGVRVVFTGHGHAQDIAERRLGARRLLDVQTGSLVSYPNPWRILAVSPDGGMDIETRTVTAIDGRPEGFPEYSLARARAGLETVFAASLARAGVRQSDAALLIGPAVETVVAFYRGDEHAGPVSLMNEELSGYGRIVAAVLCDPLRSLGNDRPPGDNALLIRLEEEQPGRSPEGHP